MVKETFSLLVRALVWGGVVLAILGFVYAMWGRTAGSMSRSYDLTIQRVRGLSSLVALQVGVSDLQTAQLMGYTGGVHATLAAEGQVLIGVDMSQARFESKDGVNCRAVLVLPAPQVQMIRLDPQRTRVMALWQSGLWKIVPGGDDAKMAVVREAGIGAEKARARMAAEPALIDNARRQAEAVLGAFAGELGWTVQVRWVE